MFGLTTLASVLLAASSVRAHATFQDMWINGVDQAGKCVRPPASNSPITDVTSDTLACNVNGNIPAAGNCAINPGDDIIVEMHQQPGDRSCSEQAIGGNHYGPTIIYMAQTSDLDITDPWTLGWFKVNQTGLIVDNPQYWATQDMNANCGYVWFHVPKDIAPGNYLVRAEVIALHVAGSIGGAQFYTSCYQVTVGGSGTASPPTVSFPGAYSATDPGILINIYTTLTGYDIPGPTVYEGGAGPAPTSSVSASSSSIKPTTAPTTTASSTKTTSTATSTSVSGPTASQYQQCGGSSYSGPTTCASPYKCVAVSPPYYYQCQ